MSDLTDLETRAKQLRLAVDQFRDRLDALSNPHCEFAHHAQCMTAVMSLLRDAQASIGAEIRFVEARRKRAALTNAEREASTNG